MRSAIRPAGLLVVILVFTWSFICWGQSTDPMQPSYLVIGNPFNQSSSGPAHSSAAVDGSVPGGVSSASQVTESTQSLGNSGSRSSGRASMSEFEAGSSQFNPGVWGAQGGWGRVSSVPGSSDSKSSTSGRGGSISTMRRAIAGGADSTAYKAAKTLSTAGTLYPLGGADVAATARKSAPGARNNEEDMGSMGAMGKGGGSSAKGGGNYSQDFPDSTKNAALISPPDPANNLVFKFDPDFGDRGFPDLGDYQFLKPTLHVGGMKSSGGPQEEDLYRRIERRLKEYREAPTGMAKSSGLEKNKLHRPSGLGNPLSTSSALQTVK